MGDSTFSYRHDVCAVVFQVRARHLEVLAWQRADPPFQHSWALPGGRLEPAERLGASIARHLATKVDVTDIAHLEQLETRSDPERDPRGRTLATAYLALIPANADPRLPGDTRWHPVDQLPETAFDHRSIIRSALERLRAKLSYTNIGFSLAPPSFTIAELQQIYAAALGHSVSATNLQRILVRREVLACTGQTAGPTPRGGRPATVYRFRETRLQVTNPFAAFRPPEATSVKEAPELSGL